ncbi:hypothetical protein AB0I50_30370 [Streptomyces prunicolor]
MTPTERGQLAHRLRLPHSPIVLPIAQQQGPPNQIGRSTRRKHIEVNQPSVQLSQPIPRRNQHPMMIGPRNQRAQLPRRRRVVEDQQHRPPLLRQQPSIQPVLPRRRLWKIRPSNPQLVQQRQHRLIRRNRILVVPPKVDEQRPARKPPVPHGLVRSTQRQRRLPDPAQPGHRADHHRQVGLRARVQ